MALLLCLLFIVTSQLASLINWFLNYILPRRLTAFHIENRLLTKSMSELILELRQKKLKSVDLVEAYIARIKEVNGTINAVIEDRFPEAIKEAQHADQLIAKANNEQQLLALFQRYPLLGMPFTVKEACGVKGLSQAVGSIHRVHEKAAENGKVVDLLRSAGCIPLLVSANPEFCLSLETNTHTNGTCTNPYDHRRTCGGSSGGEGALNGAGATLFGVGSDLGGSVRLPAMFCGVFGHKPTGGLLSIEGHYPSTKDVNFTNTYLQLGPITRFASDLPVLLQIMAGQNAEKLKFSDGVRTNDIKIYYAYGFEGLVGWMHPPVHHEIKLSITRAVKCFEEGGLFTKQVHFKSFKYVPNVALTGITQIKGAPSVLTQSAITKPSRKVLIMEMMRTLIGHSLYTKEAIFMEMMHNILGHKTEAEMVEWRSQLEEIKKELLDLLGNDGVLLFPTFHTPAMYKHTSILNILGLDTTMLFNILGFPATHIPMGLTQGMMGNTEGGMPIGFQVIAAPYQDKLCLQIATVLEAAFGGWKPMVPHRLN